jgi:hypothetical protein
MDMLLDIFKEHGALGLLLVVAVFIVLKGQFTFRYPR